MDDEENSWEFLLFLISFRRKAFFKFYFRSPSICLPNFGPLVKKVGNCKFKKCFYWGHFFQHLFLKIVSKPEFLPLIRRRIQRNHLDYFLSIPFRSNLDRFYLVIKKWKVKVDCQIDFFCFLSNLDIITATL